jgi:hypothetical protein
MQNTFRKDLIKYKIMMKMMKIIKLEREKKF